MTGGVFDRYKAHLATAENQDSGKDRIAKYFFCHFDVHVEGGECDITTMLRHFALFKLFEYLNNCWNDFWKTFGFGDLTHDFSPNEFQAK